MLLSILTFALTHWLLTSYITGVILLYVLLRTVFHLNEHNWGDITIRVVFSLLSWSALIVILGLYLINLTEDHAFDTEPPKWLRI